MFYYYYLLDFTMRYYIHSESRQFFNVRLLARKLFSMLQDNSLSAKISIAGQTGTFRSKGRYGHKTRTRNLIPEARLNLATYVPQDAPALRYTRYMQLHIVRYRKHGCDTALRSTSNST